MMKVKLKNILGLAALSMTLVANTAPTWAGLVSTPEVSIKQYSSNGTTYITAAGSMVGARYSADSRQYIGCTLHTSLDASLKEASSIDCSARDSAGKYAFCVSTDPKHVAQTQRMIDSSLISFDLTLGNSACNAIRIYDKSVYLK